MSNIITVNIKGGDKYQKILRKLTTYRVQARVGFVDGSTYEDGTSVATVAYINEYGAAGNPPRPFLKRTYERKRSKWVRGIIQNVRGHTNDYGAVKRAYEMAAITAVGDVKETINSWPPSDPRPNAPATIRAKARRGRSGKGIKAIDPNKVLVDTGYMVSRVTYEVKG